VTGIQSSTTDAVNAIGTTASTMEKISQVTAAIATTVDEQTAVRRDISRDVGLASNGTASLASNISVETTAIGQADRSAKDVLDATAELAAARKLHPEQKPGRQEFMSLCCHGLELPATHAGEVAL
jgi:methyl-accepting chemotaxis protein